tara:strand:+ start:300 stop:524 length:225 start_codon:yes stop_codon:yes gene_type:complete
MEIVEKNEEGTSPHIEVQLPSDEEIISKEIETLDVMIKEMASKVGEATVALRKLEIIRDTLSKRECAQMGLPLD